MTLPKETPMIERLARAIADALGDGFDNAFASKTEFIDARGESGGRFRDINEPFKCDYIEAAHAVLTVLLDPTLQMLLAGEAASYSWEPPTPSWRAMIDAALNEGEER